MTGGRTAVRPYGGMTSVSDVGAYSVRPLTGVMNHTPTNGTTTHPM